MVYSVLNLIESGRKALEDNNVWAALSVALMLPSVCSRMEFEKDANYKHNDGRWKDKKCYVDFCNKYFKEWFGTGSQLLLEKKGRLKELEKPSPFFKDVLGKRFAKVLYDMRCGMVHEGLVNASKSGKRLLWEISASNSSVVFSDFQIVSVKDLCKNIFFYVESWADERNTTTLKYGFVLDTEHSPLDKKRYNKGDLYLLPK